MRGIDVLLLSLMSFFPFLVIPGSFFDHEDVRMQSQATRNLSDQVKESVEKGRQRYGNHCTHPDVVRLLDYLRRDVRDYRVRPVKHAKVGIAHSYLHHANHDFGKHDARADVRRYKVFRMINGVEETQLDDNNSQIHRG